MFVPPLVVPGAGPAFPCLRAAVSEVLREGFKQRLQSSLGSAYTLERELGGGGMSRVFVAEEARLGRRVVVKVLAPELTEGMNAELRTHLARVGRLSLDAAVSVLRDVARALEYAHAHDVVHRDIKPDNILLAGSAAAVTDFGIAKALYDARAASVAKTATDTLRTGERREAPGSERQPYGGVMPIEMETAMPVESPVEYERIWIEGLNRGDVSVADAVFSPDCVIHITGVAAPLRGLGPWKALVGGLLAAFPDIRFSIEEQFIQGDRVAFRWRVVGTHTGPLGEVPPTGKQVALDGLIVDHLEDGKVRERWEQWDQSLMLQQLGLA